MELPIIDSLHTPRRHCEVSEQGSLSPSIGLVDVLVDPMPVLVATPVPEPVPAPEPEPDPVVGVPVMVTKPEDEVVAAGSCAQVPPLPRPAILRPTQRPSPAD